MDGRSFKEAVYERLAAVSKALGSPRRLELVDLLQQAERPVDWLARATRQSVANTSQHLQILRSARVVEARRDGQHVVYRLASPEVGALALAIRAAAEARDAEIARLVADVRAGHGDVEAIGPAELHARMARGEVELLDVRPEEEYRTGHVPGARNVPLEALDSADFDGRDVVVYCRGPYCLLADEAAARLRAAGRRVARLDGGVPEWAATGLPVRASTRP
jgi:rhodanese-related sulfurtransferase/DNA-binding transcriptional ArsR family regulator